MRCVEVLLPCQEFTEPDGNSINETEPAGVWDLVQMLLLA